VNALMSAGAPAPQLDGKQSLLHLIEQLSKKTDCNQVYIRRAGFSLAMGKSGRGKAQGGARRIQRAPASSSTSFPPSRK